MEEDNPRTFDTTATILRSTVVVGFGLSNKMFMHHNARWLCDLSVFPSTGLVTLVLFVCFSEH